jgi:UDP-N-acetylmuramoylalanine--D-glutamate ligase
VVVVGLARQGKAAARYLAARGAKVTVSDRKTADQLAAEVAELEGLDIEFILGGHPPELLEGADLLCLSGGVPAGLPLAQQARRRGIRLTNDAQLFLEAAPAPTIGITGSAGKTTTTALVGRMAAAALAPKGQRAWVAGNIGRSPLADIDHMSAGDWIVLELSSFQLELMTASPHVAAVLNVTPNHLDRHQTMEAYRAAKARILEFQGPQDVAVLGREDPGAWSLRDRVRGRVVSFGVTRPVEGDGTFVKEGAIWWSGREGETLLLETAAIELRGAHNLSNVLAASAIAAASGFSPEAIRAGVLGYRGEPHRMMFVRHVGGADWYDDSIATAPERALAALRSFDEPLILLAGGRDKDLPWSDFAQIVIRRVDHVVLFGEAGPLIELALRSAMEGSTDMRLETLDRVPGLDEAVDAAARRAAPGDVILLSPGGTSFDEFPDFAARGDRFQERVNRL